MVDSHGITSICNELIYIKSVKGKREVEVGGVSTHPFRDPEGTLDWPGGGVRESVRRWKFKQELEYHLHDSDAYPASRPALCVKRQFEVA